MNVWKIQVKSRISVNDFVKWLAFITIFICPMRAQMWSIQLIGGKLSPFRFLLCLTMILIIKKNNAVRVCTKGNKYSVLFMYVWFLYAVFSVLWSNNIGAWLKNVFFIFVGFSSAIVFINTLTDIADIKKALFFLLLGIIVQSIVGWYEIVTLNYRYMDIAPESLYAYRQSICGFTCGVPIAMCGNPNDFATLMFIGVFLLYIFWKESGSKIISIICVTCQLSLFIQIIISSSRAAILGTIIAFFLIVSMQIKKENFCILMIGGLVVLTLIVLLNADFFITNLFVLNFSNVEGSDSVRLNLIKNGIFFTLQTYGVGTGAGQIESWISGKAVYYVSHYTNMHNWWIEILTAYGILIFASYMLFYIKLFLNIYRDYRKRNVCRYVSLGICSIMSGYILTGISSSSNMNSEYMWIFWSICIAYQGIICKCNGSK